MTPIAYRHKQDCYCVDCGKYMHDNFIDVNAIYLYTCIPKDWCEICLMPIVKQDYNKARELQGIDR